MDGLYFSHYTYPEPFCKMLWKDELGGCFHICLDSDSDSVMLFTL